MSKTLFLPGAGGSSIFWQPVAEILNVDAKLLAWPGLGNEPHSEDISGIDDLVTLVQRHIDGPVSVVAQSIGGLVAVKAALLNQANVRRLVLVVTSAGVKFSNSNATDWRLEYRQEFPNAAKWVEEVQPDISEQLTKLNIPTLLIWGDTDTISPVAAGQRINELIPNSSLHIVKGGEHDLARTHASEIAPLIEKHIADSG